MMNHSFLKRFDLTGRTALLTGGSQGIGFACAEALAEAGAHVIVTARSAEPLEAAVSALRDKGCSAEYRILDVTDSAAVNALAEQLEPLDILIANAGIARSGVAGHEVPDEQFLDVMNVNVNGVYWCCRAFGAKMRARGSGSIVAIGSISALIVNTPQNQSYYNASKAAVHQLIKSLAVEWASSGVRLNAVAPGYIDTPMTAYGMEDDPEMAAKWLSLTPMGRVGKPEEVGSIALFLASDAASYMTGSVVVADGGYTLW
jgi:NAD(P)-dependent dehydrogenase (short-subunit alcohol dehydrogenase family)